MKILKELSEIYESVRDYVFVFVSTYIVFEFILKGFPIVSKFLVGGVFIFFILCFLSNRVIKIKEIER